MLQSFYNETNVEVEQDNVKETLEKKIIEENQIINVSETNRG
jgi:hypothetical protein